MITKLNSFRREHDSWKDRITIRNFQSSLVLPRWWIGCWNFLPKNSRTLCSLNILHTHCMSQISSVLIQTLVIYGARSNIHRLFSENKLGKLRKLFRRSVLPASFACIYFPAGVTRHPSRKIPVWRVIINCSGKFMRYILCKYGKENG